ncbi:MAG: SPOR domain-containing protein [Planctomycetota bacterium]
MASGVLLGRHQRSGWVVIVTLAVGMAVGGMGCQVAPGPTLDGAYRLYEAGETGAAFADAAELAGRAKSGQRFEAAYLAGLSAKDLGDGRSAVRYLIQATRSPDPVLAGDAGVTLGTVHAEAGRHQAAADAYLAAADRLIGEGRAKASFFAAVAQQKLGQWAQARTNFILARAQSADPILKRRATEQLRVSGFTIQLGAFRNAANARGVAEGIAAEAVALGLGRPRLVASVLPETGSVTLVHVGTFSTFGSAALRRDAMGVEGVIVPISE